MKTFLITTVLLLTTACGSNTVEYLSPDYDAAKMAKYATNNMESYYRQSYKPVVQLQNKKITYNTTQYPQYASLRQVAPVTAYTGYHSRSTNYW